MDGGVAVRYWGAACMCGGIAGTGVDEVEGCTLGGALGGAAGLLLLPYSASVFCQIVRLVSSRYREEITHLEHIEVHSVHSHHKSHQSISYLRLAIQDLTSGCGGCFLSIGSVFLSEHYKKAYFKL